GRVDRFFRRARHAPGRDRDAVVGKQLLGLVFVKVHVGSVLGRIAASPGPGGLQAARGRILSRMGRSRAKAPRRGAAPGGSGPILAAGPLPRHSPLAASQAVPPARPGPLRRELYLFALYRLFESALLALI